MSAKKFYNRKKPDDIVNEQGHLLVIPVIMCETEDAVYLLRTQKYLLPQEIKQILPQPIEESDIQTLRGVGQITININRSSFQSDLLSLPRAIMTYIPRCVVESVHSGIILSYVGEETYSGNCQHDVSFNYLQSMSRICRIISKKKVIYLPEVSLWKNILPS